MQKIKRKGEQSGFTLIEVIITLSLILVFSAIVIPLFTGVMNFVSRVDTQANIQVLGEAVEEWYEENAWNIDSQGGASVVLPNGQNMTNNSSTLSNDGWKQLALKYTSSQRYLVDGENQGFRIFVSNRQEQMYEGVLIPYHVIAIVSGNGVQQADNTGTSVVQSTFNVGNGQLTPHPEDEVYVVSGFDIQKQKFKESQKRLETVAQAYEDYYWSRFVGQGSEPAINYFGARGGNPRWDTGATINVVCGGNNSTSVAGRRALGNSIQASNLPSVLQLPTTSVESSWGRDLRLLNCGSTSNARVGYSTITFRARDPNNGGYPPYTAILGFTLPNGQTYSSTVTSKF